MAALLELSQAEELGNRAALHLKNEILVILGRLWPARTFDDIKDLSPGEFLEQLLAKRYMTYQSLESISNLIAEQVQLVVTDYNVGNLKALWNKSVSFPEVECHVPMHIVISGKRSFKAFILVRESRRGSEYVLVFNRQGVGYGTKHQEGQYYLFNWKEIRIDALPEFVIEGWMTQIAVHNEFSVTSFRGCGLEILSMFENESSHLPPPMS